VKCLLSCMICDVPFEDLNHVFFNFAFVVRVWNWSGLWDVIQHALSLRTATVYTIFHLLHELARENSQLFCLHPLESLETQKPQALARNSRNSYLGY
jgi:hypothetical protein